MRPSLLGLSAIALAIGFNIPYGMLAAEFDYPAILRQPAAEVLVAFAEGGPRLVLVWYAFALSAMALIPFALALAFAPGTRPGQGLATAAAIAGALAGFAQATGLVRWVFAVPVLASAHAAPDATEAQRAATEAAFVLLNQWGGVGIGEHIGQMLTVLWVALTAVQRAQRGGLARAETALATIAALGIAIGLGEGIAIATGTPAPAFALFTIAGYLGFSAWLVLMGVNLMRNRA